MRIIVLSSDHPNFAHSGPNNIVLAALLEGLSSRGHHVGWAVAGPDRLLAEETRCRLSGQGIDFIGDFTDHLEFGPQDGVIKKGLLLRKALFPRRTDDLPRFRQPDLVVAQLVREKPDLVVLFWDTWFEYLVEAMHGLRVIGYLAKPRHDAPLVRLDHNLVNGKLRNPLRQFVARRLLEHQRGRHFHRVRALRGVAEICALDAGIYRQLGVKAAYVPITTPDFFGPDCEARRRSAEAGGQEFGVVGALGTLHTLGTSIGIEFWCRDVLPRLTQIMPHEHWVINVYGRGSQPAVLAGLGQDPHITFRGFVPDIDNAMLSNQAFLFCNNAGPYRGAYTRVVYAFSSGTCMIAHRSLSESMPEVQHGNNALLGETGGDIANLVALAASDRRLRERIGAAARATYEDCFAPAAVGRKLDQFFAESLA